MTELPTFDGLSVLVVGGGPCDVDRIVGVDRVVCVNWAWRTWELDPDVWVSADQVVFKGSNREPAWHALRCPKVAVDIDGQKLYGGRHLYHVVRGVQAWGHWGRTVEEGMRVGSKGTQNSGLPAINLADALGARRLYLLGFTLQPPYDKYLDDFHDGLSLCRAEIVNLTPGSLLEV